ncbi:MAG: DUF4387 domain-containing protein [Betaproteobacteria bacterium]|jgi:hypothetical protein
MPKISELAKVCKSKNAGPFEVTIDVMFETKEIFDKVEQTGVLCAALFSKLYNVPEKAVLFTIYPAALAFKGTIPRCTSSGDIGDTDVYGAQQHAPLLDVEIPI